MCVEGEDLLALGLLGNLGDDARPGVVVRQLVWRENNEVRKGRSVTWVYMSGRKATKKGGRTAVSALGASGDLLGLAPVHEERGRRELVSRP